MKPSFYLPIYTLLLLFTCLFPRDLGPKEISSNLPPKEGDNFKAVGKPTVYKLVNGKKLRYQSANKFLTYQNNLPFGTPYEQGGILVCNLVTVKAIPDSISHHPTFSNKATNKWTVFRNTFFRSDKFFHFLGYFIWSLLYLWTIQTYSWSLQKEISSTLTIGSFLGILVEFLQYYSAVGRAAEFLDLFFNTLGIIAALFVYKRTNFIRKNNARKSLR